MSAEIQPDQIAKKEIVYTLPGTDAVTVRSGIEYRTTDSGALTMDLYYPPGTQQGARAPAVIFVLGYSDLGIQAMFGCKLKDFGAYTSWAKLMAAAGLVAITYTTHDPAPDAQAVLQHISQNAAALGIDANRIGVWSSSGNVPVALSLLMQKDSTAIRCAALNYGYTLDGEGFKGVAEAASTFMFANPCAGKSVDDLRADLPLLLVRAGQDQMAKLNEAMDRFVLQALARNLPVTVINYAEAPHAFDMFLDSERSHEVIRQELTFMRFHLLA